MCIIEFLNQYNGALMVIITAIYVAATIIICYANLKSATSSKEQLQEMRKQFSEENRPIIEVEILYEKRMFWGLRFVNHGRRTANNVEIQLDESFIDSLEENTFSSLLRKQAGKQCVIGVDQHYDLFFGTNKYRSNPHKVAASGKISYSGGDSTYESKFCLDTENYATVFSIGGIEEDFLEEIKMQTTILGNICSAIQEQSVPLSTISEDKKEEDKMDE